MPRVIDYADVQQQLTAAGLTCLYHNSGAFGFTTPVAAAGWLGREDPTIRDSARALARQVSQPHAPTLARMLEAAWLRHLPGEAWLMPKSHWHYEMHFGNRDLLEPVLTALDIDPSLLRDRNSGDAIAFMAEESELLCSAAARLLEGLRGSDFVVAFPDHAAVCTIHHHMQLWWQTPDAALAAALSELEV
jgi:hypothetical protein